MEPAYGPFGGGSIQNLPKPFDTLEYQHTLLWISTASAERSVWLHNPTTKNNEGGPDDVIG
ncbi:unnamed protein product [Orchesella dallaii]|uniref:Uncharacterized protein n=1 Tax=Orchesella dallaii TaxID=48710 RepID=A0ABP1S0Y3_9HEXA